MKGFIIFISLVCLFKANFVVADEYLNLKKNQTILILKSKESSYYNQTIHTIKNALSEYLNLDIQNINQNPSLNNAKLIITLGKSAAIFAREHFPDTAKIMTFLSLKQSSFLQINSNEIHLLIELPTSKYISFANLILPQKRLGVLYQKSVTNLLELSAKNIFLVEVSRRNKIISATRDIIKSSDALIALPNKDIFNRHSLKGILLSTYQNDTPLISYSPAHVKAGAVAAIYASPTNLGEHATDIINSLFKTSRYEPKRFFSKYFSVKVNQRVAQSLGLSLDSPERLIKNVKRKNLVDG